MVTVLLAAAIASLAPVSAADEEILPVARPAMWLVSDEDTTIYLFGTFHALDGKSNWFTEGVKTAFMASDELVLETLLPAKPTSRRGLDVNSVASSPIKPGASFLASTRLALSAGHSRGLSVDLGADQVLRRAAVESGKPVSGIETFEFQLGMFSQIPAAPAPRLTAAQGQAAVETLAHTMSVMQLAWNRGDGRIFADMLDNMHQGSPETYRILFVDRNERWAEWIANRLDRPGTVFVAVGAGHLAGPDSLQNKLGQIGVRSSRIN
ncbi:MAG TPA: TraB/GumN family protein [Sphingomicrobium sp.]|nr:TraB/GumN family protein [Sphingomicrobium sp.]